MCKGPMKWLFVLFLWFKMCHKSRFIVLGTEIGISHMGSFMFFKWKNIFESHVMVIMMLMVVKGVGWITLKSPLTLYWTGCYNCPCECRISHEKKKT